MDRKCKTFLIIKVTLLSFVLMGYFSVDLFAAEAESLDPNESSEYLQAVRTFADNVLKYGRDTYGPKHTPLFVDGLNIHTHEPVKWISKDGEKWILSDLTNQQDLFRALHGLTIITGDPKYKQAAMDAIDYAFKKLRSPNGLLHWGCTAAYDALGDKPCGRNTHVFKGFFPYYELMWQVNPEATKQLIEAFWSAHIKDWSNLDMDRIGSLEEELEEPWVHEYKGGPVFFEGYLSAAVTGSDLSYAAAVLFNLSGEKEPLVWSKRLAYRYIETRDPNIGISGFAYSLPRYSLRHPLAKDFKRHLVNSFTIFPFAIEETLDPVVSKCKLAFHAVSPGIPYTYVATPGIWNLRIGELLGVEGKEFTQWALEELTARGKVAYRRIDNVWIPMLLDGTSLEGYAYKEDAGYNPEGTVFKPVSAVLMDFWGYALAYRLTHDEFMWDMARNIGRGNGLGDIGETPEDKLKLQIPREHFDPYTLLAFLELYRKTGETAFLQAARKVGDHILALRFHKGFFVPSSKHIYTKFDAIEALALLHLDAVGQNRELLAPQVWPGVPFFNFPFRKKDWVVDNALIYTLTETSEPPRSLGEAAARGDVEEATSLIAQGADVNSREGIFLYTPLMRAVIKGREDVVKLLLANGAQVNIRENGYGTALHYAAEGGYEKIVELLIASGADVNATNSAGDTPIDVGVRRNHREIVRLLVANGAEISMHDAVDLGDLERVKSLIANGADVNAQDSSGKTPLYYAIWNKDKNMVELLIASDADVNVKNLEGDPLVDIAVRRRRRHADHLEILELLIDNGADINVKNKLGYTPLYHALWNNDKATLRLLAGKGADIDFTPDRDLTPLGYAIWYEDKEMVELFVSHGAKLEVKDHWGYTALRNAAGTGDRELIEFFVSKGADISGFHRAACLGDLAGAKGFVQQGVDIDTRDEMDWTPLHWAASTGQEDVGELLVSNGADVNAKTSDNSTPLHHAARSGSVRLVELLISKGADAKAADEYETTPLHNAALRGSRVVAELLMDAGATIDVEEMREDQTPLHKAARAGHKDVVELLLATGADVNVRDKRGRTPLWHAENKGHTEIVELLREHGAYDAELDDPFLQAVRDGDVNEVKSLLSKGADVNARNQRATALQNATEAGHKHMMELLINAGANVNIRDPGGVTPLHCWAAYGHKDIVELLINKGADVMAKHPLGHTPLHSASSGGHRDVVELLIAKGADVNAKQTDGQTALHEAAKWGHTDVAELLISKGANVNAEDKDGRTPLWYAKASGNEDIVGLFPKAGPGRDVALTDISASSFCTRGEDVSVVVNVVNRSDYSEMLAVTLTDITDDMTIVTKSIHLSPTGVDGMDEVCDLTFASPAGSHDLFGHSINCGGDVNGDGYTDLIISATYWNNKKGRVYLYYGGLNIDNIPDKIFTGEHDGERFGARVCLGNVNGDIYDDVIVGAPAYNSQQGRVYVFYGGRDMDLKHDLTIEGKAGMTERFGAPVSVGNVNNDNYDDLLVSATSFNLGYGSGRAYLYYGGDPMDTNCVKVFEGENDNDLFGMGADIGDVDGDGYNDVLIGASFFPGRNPEQGRAYLYYGNDKANMDTICDLVFRCPESGRNQFGNYVDIFDIDNDGHSDVLISARKFNNYQGRVYLYWGGKRETMDNVADVVFSGDVKSSLGGNTVRAGYINGDPYGDIIVSAYDWPQANHTGRVHVYYGGTKTLIDTNVDKMLTGVLRSYFSKWLDVGDMNNDNYDDIAVSALNYNYDEGRAWLYYGSPGDSTQLKFNWDTTDASIGEHTLRAEIAPIAGEEDTADNIMTITVDVKAPLQ